MTCNFITIENWKIQTYLLEPFHMYRRHAEDEKNDRARSVRGLSEAYRFACNDAKFLSRYFQLPDSDYMLNNTVSI